MKSIKNNNKNKTQIYRIGTHTMKIIYAKKQNSKTKRKSKSKTEKKQTNNKAETPPQEKEKKRIKQSKT